MAKSPQKPEVDMSKLKNFSEADVEAARSGYEVFDKGKPTVSVEELKVFLETSGLSIRYPTVFSIIDKITETNPKGLNFKSFMESFQGFLGNRETKAGAKKLFEALDIDSKEYLDKDRLSSIAKEIGENISRSEMDYTISTSFDCSDGKVTFEAFQRRLLKLKNNS